MDMPEPEFLRTSPRRQPRPKMPPRTMREPNPLRCPEGHPAWNLYHKRIEGTTDTLVCCKACEGSER